jgi:hypothetical protein
MNEQKHLQQPANGVLLLMAVANASMLDAARCKGKKVIVVCDDDASFPESVGDVICVGRPEQVRLDGGLNVHAMASESNSDCRPYTLVKMIPNHHGHLCWLGN